MNGIDWDTIVGPDLIRPFWKIGDTGERGYLIGDTAYAPDHPDFHIVTQILLWRHQAQRERVCTIVEMLEALR